MPAFLTHYVPLCVGTHAGTHDAFVGCAGVWLQCCRMAGRHPRTARKHSCCARLMLHGVVLAAGGGWVKNRAGACAWLPLQLTPGNLVGGPDKVPSPLLRAAGLIASGSDVVGLDHRQSFATH